MKRQVEAFDYAGVICKALSKGVVESVHQLYFLSSPLY